MKPALCSLVPIACALVVATLTGCGSKTPALPPSVTAAPAKTAVPVADDHDHGDHGPHGGIMVSMSDGTQIEVEFADDYDNLTVHPANPGATSRVAMVTTIDGKETTYEFEKKDAFSGVVFPITNEELSTAVQMGDAVDVKLIIESGGETITGKFEYHSH